MASSAQCAKALMCRSVMDVEDLALVWCVIAAPRILLLYQKRLGDVLLSSDKSQKQPWFDINHQECSYTRLTTLSVSILSLKRWSDIDVLEKLRFLRFQFNLGLSTSFKFLCV